MSEHKTTLDKLLENKRYLKMFMAMPDHIKEEMVDEKREVNFSFVWEHNLMEKDEAISVIKDREKEFVNDVHQEPIPEAMLRMEAQDLLLQKIHETMDEAGVLG